MGEPQDAVAGVFASSRASAGVDWRSNDLVDGVDELERSAALALDVLGA